MSQFDPNLVPMFINQFLAGDLFALNVFKDYCEEFPEEILNYRTKFRNLQGYELHGYELHVFNETLYRVLQGHSSPVLAPQEWDLFETPIEVALLVYGDAYPFENLQVVGNSLFFTYRDRLVFVADPEEPVIEVLEIGQIYFKRLSSGALRLIHPHSFHQITLVRPSSQFYEFTSHRNCFVFSYNRRGWVLYREFNQSGDFIVEEVAPGTELYTTSELTYLFTGDDWTITWTTL